MPPPGRVVSLDLIRGVAVLGILAINIAGFAGPPLAILTPDWPRPATPADTIAFATSFVLFEGKMRALFTILFGASLVLFIERADARGGFGDLLQLRRLGWLALAGLAHFYLLWWGDILFLYALCGIVALLMREVSVRTLVVSALIIYLGWHGLTFLHELPGVLAEEAVRTGTASAAQAHDHLAYAEIMAAYAAEQFAIIQGSFTERLHARLIEETFRPLGTLTSAVGETFPLILLGMALERSGFFSGGWSARTLRRLAFAGTGTGLALTLGLLALVWPRGFPSVAMETIFLSAGAIPHLLMALGYAALLVLAAPRLGAAAAGRALSAAGRMALSNYIGTSLVMTAIFYGWGLGLAGVYGHAALWPFVLGAWTLMLAGSAAWLSRFRRGPLEWGWRCLTEWRILTNRR